MTTSTYLYSLYIGAAPWKTKQRNEFEKTKCEYFEFLSFFPFFFLPSFLLSFFFLLLIAINYCIRCMWTLYIPNNCFAIGDLFWFGTAYKLQLTSYCHKTIFHYTYSQFDASLASGYVHVLQAWYEYSVCANYWEHVCFRPQWVCWQLPVTACTQKFSLVQLLTNHSLKLKTVPYMYITLYYRSFSHKRFVQQSPLDSAVLFSYSISVQKPWSTL